ncbi:MAG: OadG family protein [Anaerolineales bacterium]|nr:OadG family protein [Anaerolineales bacterium]
MSANLAAALQISLIGMTFVIATLAGLAVVTAALVRLTAEREPPPAAPAAVGAPNPATPEQPDRARRAAAAAVALARALAGEPPGARMGPAHIAAALSPWQAARRAQQLRQRDRQR